MADENMIRLLMSEGYSETSACAIADALEASVERAAERHKVSKTDALKFSFFKKKAENREKLRDKILESQSEDREIERWVTWENEWDIDPVKEREIMLWLNTIPEDALYRGKDMKAQYNHGVKIYPPEYWEKVEKRKFDEHLVKLASRRREIMQQEDIREIMVMFSLFELEEMLLYRPVLFKTCPKFLLEELDEISTNPYRFDEYHLVNLAEYCI